MVGRAAGKRTSWHGSRGSARRRSRQRHRTHSPSRSRSVSSVSCLAALSRAGAEGRVHNRHVGNTRVGCPCRSAGQPGSLGSPRCGCHSASSSSVRLHAASDTQFHDPLTTPWRPLTGDLVGASGAVEERVLEGCAGHWAELAAWLPAVPSVEVRGTPNCGVWPSE
jgi:hypothetical protein